MAFNNSITARYDELRSPNPPTSNGTGTTTPSSRYSGSFLPNHSQSFGSDARASLQRRQTTDLSKMPPMTPIGQQPAQAMNTVDMSATVSCFHPYFCVYKHGIISLIIQVVCEHLRVAALQYTLLRSTKCHTMT